MPPNKNKGKYKAPMSTANSHRIPIGGNRRASGLTSSDWRQPAAGSQMEVVQTYGSPAASVAVTSNQSSSPEGFLGRIRPSHIKRVYGIPLGDMPPHQFSRLPAQENFHKEPSVGNVDGAMADVDGTMTDVDGTMADVDDVDDEGGVDIKTTPAGKYSNDDVQQETKRSFSPGPRYRSFVQHGAESRGDDVFAPSASYRPIQRRLFKSRSAEATPTPRRHASYLQTNWRSNESGSGGSNSVAYQRPYVTDEVDIDNSGAVGSVGFGRVTALNAQAFYPPSACVFVANLSSFEDEMTLECEVTRLFKRYGTVFVKIRRDSKNMPFAFCQFTNDDDAKKAILNAKGIMIHGRPCRTEQAKAPRTYYLSRQDGVEVGEEEGTDMLEQYGEVDRTWLATPDDMFEYGVSGGFFVEFRFFDVGRKIQQAIRGDGFYCLDAIKIPFRSKFLTEKSENQATRRAREYLREYERDRNSIFIGNIPPHFGDDNLRALFEHYGHIVSIAIIRSPSSLNQGTLHIHGFVEYDNAMSAARAIKAKANSIVDAYVLKVLHKNSEYRAGRSGNRSSNTGRGTMYRSPPHSRAMNATPQVASQGVPYGYGYPTPAYSVYYPGPQYAAPYQYTWNNSPPYVGQFTPQAYAYPPVFYGSPTPNAYYAPQYPVDYNWAAQYQQQMAYYQQPYAAQETMVETAQETMVETTQGQEEDVAPVEAAEFEPMAVDNETSEAQ